MCYNDEPQIHGISIEKKKKKNKATTTTNPLKSTTSILLSHSEMDRGFRLLLPLFLLFSLSTSSSSSSPLQPSPSGIRIVNITFSPYCPYNYKETAVAIKKLLKNFFPEMEVIFSKPSLPANWFGIIASTWLPGNVCESKLDLEWNNFILYHNCYGAFEVHYNGDLVFSKLKEGKLPRVKEATNLIMDRMPLYRYGPDPIYDPFIVM